MNFANAAKATIEGKYTENGAFAYNTTSNDLLDFFSTAGALRNRTDSEIERKFELAFRENPLFATKALFYTRDIRNGGLGERRTFRICLKWLSNNYPEVVSKNLHLIPWFGRFDDLFCLLDEDSPNNRKEALDFISVSLLKDIDAMLEHKPISLLAKWLPSINTSSEKTRNYAKMIISDLHVSEKTYRKVLSDMRNYLKVVERSMSDKRWQDIAYKEVPSYAMKNYRKAFLRHDSERFNKYIELVSKGKQKINASTLYPYDLVHQYKLDSWYQTICGKLDPVIEEQWKALPNYVEGENNFIIMADVSGSMMGRPIETSIGLATYFAQRNKGYYKNLYMTFSGEPHFIDISKDKTLYSAVNHVATTDIGYNTNLKKAFEYILSTAIENEIAAEDMPKALVVISDMEIDCYSPNYHGWSKKGNLDFVQTMKRKFAANGYLLPKLIMWNVEARNDTFLTQDKDVLFVSGQSASTFKKLCGSLEGKTAYDFMIDILCADAYKEVRV